MCGIWASFGFSADVVRLLSNAMLVSSRGPDGFRAQAVPKHEHCMLVHHHLFITDIVQQPMKLVELPHVTLCYNGEIYNYKQLAEQHNLKLQTSMDGEIIIHLYAKLGFPETLRLLDGVYALIVFDSATSTLYLARDTFGVRPMFTYHSNDGELAVSSEAKGLIGLLNSLEDKIKPFPPATYVTYQIESESGKARETSCCQFTRVDETLPPSPNDVIIGDGVLANIRNLLEDAVRKRFMSKRRIGCLLSGGVDSSLIAALVCKVAKDVGLAYPVQTFSVGQSSSPDVLAARKVAKHIGSEHHEVIFTPEEAIGLTEEAIRTAETFDTVTVRGCIAMHFLAMYIKKNTDSTVIFIGEGSDEVTQGYLHFHKAPTPSLAHAECKRLLQDIYLYDGLRPDRAVASQGLELRVPFLDKRFVAYYLSLPVELTKPIQGVEKQLLRTAFSDTDLIPHEILWRSKLCFSYGLSGQLSFGEMMEQYAESKYTAAEYSSASKLYPETTPVSCESFFYRKCFEKHFPGQSQLTPGFWADRHTWSSK